MSTRSTRSRNSAKTKQPDYEFSERTNKRRKVVSYKEASSSDEDFENFNDDEKEEEGSDENEDNDADFVIADDREEEDEEEEDFIPTPKRSSRASTKQIEEGEEEVEEGEEEVEEGEEEVEEGEENNDEDGEEEEDFEKEESKVIDENEDEIEDDKDLVREERLRMRRALAERKVQEEKRLVLNKLLKRRVGANRGDKQKELEGNTVANNATEEDELNTNEDKAKKEKKILPREKLPRRIIYSSDGSIIYKME